MGFPEGLTVRGAEPADARRVFELIAAADLADTGEKMIDVSDIESDWAAPGRSIADDVLLVESGGELVAWGQVEGDHAEADVHPDHRDRGIGLALVEWIERTARDRWERDGDPRVGQSLLEGLPGTNELFADRGYERSWDSWLLRLPAHVTPVAPALDRGVTIRTAQQHEDHAVYTVIENAFAEWDDRTPRTYEEWRAFTTGRSDFDRSLLFVAAADDSIVGACVGLQYPDEGWAHHIAVAPESRGRGIGRAMLIELFDEFRSRGETNLGLNTDSRTGALDLYLDIGMVVTQTFTRWSRTL